MKHVVFHVDDGDVGRLGERTDIGIALAVHPADGIAEDPNADRLAVAGEDLGDIVDTLGHEGLLVALNLWGVHRVRVEVDAVPTELMDPGLEAVPSPQAL